MTEKQKVSGARAQRKKGGVTARTAVNSCVSGLLTREVSRGKSSLVLKAACIVSDSLGRWNPGSLAQVRIFNMALLPRWLRQKRICLQCKRPGFHPWVGKIPWRRNGNPLQHSCLENPMDRGARRATVHGVTKSQTRLSD